MTATFCAATFSNSYVLWHKRCVMLRFVAVPNYLTKKATCTKGNNWTIYASSIFAYTVTSDEYSVIFLLQRSYTVNICTVRKCTSGLHKHYKLDCCWCLLLFAWFITCMSCSLILFQSSNVFCLSLSRFLFALFSLLNTILFPYVRYSHNTPNSIIKQIHLDTLVPVALWTLAISILLSHP